MRPLRAIPAVLALLAVACGGGRRVPPPPPVAIDPPALRIETFAPESLDAYGVTLALRGVVENPNPVALSVARFDYAIDVDGQRVAAGRIDSGLGLPARGAVPVVVPARLLWSQVPGFLAMLAVRESLPFRVSGAATAGVRGRWFQLPYGHEGAVVLPRLPGVALERAVVRESSLFQTVVELAFVVQNPNPFPLPVGRLSYDLSISGAQVARAQSFSLVAVPAGGSATVLVPVKFSTIGAVAGALSGAASGRTEVVLTGSVAYGGFEIAIDARSRLTR